MSYNRVPHWDFCKAQILINKLGGDEEFPAFPKGAPGDVLTQFGFDGGHEATPTGPGVYAVVAVAYSDNARHMGAEHLLYIGSAKNIRARLHSRDHWYNKLYKRMRGANVYTRHLVNSDYHHIERSLIRTLRPLLNVQHNRRNG